MDPFKSLVQTLDNGRFMSGEVWISLSDFYIQIYKSTNEYNEVLIFIKDNSFAMLAKAYLIGGSYSFNVYHDVVCNISGVIEQLSDNAKKFLSCCNSEKINLTLLKGYPMKHCPFCNIPFGYTYNRFQAIVDSCHD